MGKNDLPPELICVACGRIDIKRHENRWWCRRCLRNYLRATGGR